MPEVKFYILSTDSQEQRQRFACKLIEKIYRSGQNCFVMTDSEQQSQLLDDLLWSFRATSFIPHQIQKQEAPGVENKILIGHQAAPEQWQSNLLNLSSNYPKQLNNTQYILEILDNSEQCKAAGRLRYRQYQQANFKIETHQM